MVMEIEKHYSVYHDLTYFNRGECKYRMEKYSEALEDFKKVKDSSALKAQKHNNIGLCYYSLTSFKDAEDEYREAIKSDSNLVEFYYNLGVLYNNINNQPDKANRQFNTCIKVNKKFSKARDAIEKLKGSNPLDWYNWWFGNGKIKKALVVVLILSILTFALIVGTMIASIFSVLNSNLPANQSIISPANQSIISPAITGITIIEGLLIVILLLPSLKRVKVLDIELEAKDIPIIKPNLEGLLSSPVAFTTESY
jgi:tetratricopeptide (TPR) repeat protein